MADLNNSAKKSGWKAIWSTRGAAGDDPSGLETLLALDGFDTAAGRMTPATWLAYVERIAVWLQLAPGQPVVEIGCGAGAFLYGLRKRGHPVYGLDYAENLIRVARRVLGDGRFVVGEAGHLPYAEATFAAVVSNGVFIYFPDLPYAEAAIAEIARVLKPRGRAALLDVNDGARRADYQRIKRAALGDEGYRRAYGETPHLFYDRRWMSDIAGRYGLTCAIEDQNIPGYANAGFRFNVLLTKRP